MSFFNIYTILFALTFTLSADAKPSKFRHAKKTKYTNYYLALGDSMTAAFLGNTSASQKTSKEKSKDGELTVLAMKEDPKPPYMWNGWRYASLVESKRTWSWASGRKLYSVRERLEHWIKDQPGASRRTRVKAMNYAESGIRSEHLPRQASRAAKKLKRSKVKSLDLITYVFGGNDVCKGRKTEADREKMIQNFSESLERIRPVRSQVSPEKRIPVFVSALPRVPDLAKPEIANHKAFWGLSCKWVRNNLVNTCRKLMNWTTHEEYEERISRVEFVNESLEIAVDQYDGDPDFDVHFDSQFYDQQLTGPMLSIDCFHPGKKGQELLSEMFWQGMPWFK